MKVAFIGMGTMGGPMAANLARQFEVQVWNRSSDSPFLQQAVAAGCRQVEDLATVGLGADAVFTCLPDTPQLEQVLFGESALLANLKQSAKVIDCSTIGKQAALSVGARLADHGIEFVDAPVSGGDIGAQQGTLTFFIGSTETQFAELKPLFEAMGKNLFHCGDLGSGQAVKLVNQHLCAVNMVAVTEAFLLAQDLRVDFDKVSQFCATGAGGSWALANLGPQIAASDFAPGFKVSLMRKDLGLVLREAEAAAMPGLQHAIKMFAAIPLAHEEVGTQAMVSAYKQE